MFELTGMHIGRGLNVELEGPGLVFRYQMIDLRDLDGERLLASDQVGDNVIAILTRLRDRKGAVREMMGKMADLEPEPRGADEEAKKVPVLNDVLEHKVLGREFKKGMDEGMQQGARHEAVTMLRRLLEKRFGSVPGWAEERLSGRSVSELEDISVRVLDATSLEDLIN